MYILYNPRTKNPSRYWNDYRLDDEEKYENNKKPKECKYHRMINCYKKDPVSGVDIPLLYITDEIYICQNCKDREKYDKWFKVLQETEIPSVLPQFRTMKGRLCGDTRTFWGSKISTEFPPSEDRCWQFYSILEDNNQID